MKVPSARHRTSYKMVSVDRPLDLSISSRNLPFFGKSFYLDLPQNKSSQILTETIKKLGGVIEAFLSREVTYVISGCKEAWQSDGTAWRTGSERKNATAPSSRENTKTRLPPSTKQRLAAIPAGSSGLDDARRSKPVNNPALISRGKELLNKAMQKKDGGTSVLANARSWGVHVLHVNEVLDYVEKLTLVAKNLSSQKTEVAAPGPARKARKVAQLKSPFLKIEDQSRLFRPLHHHFQSFPQLNVLAARGFSLFEVTSLRSSRKDKEIKDKAVDAECYFTHSEGEERSPKAKPTIAAKKRRNGYCECCQEAFEELETHLYSEPHLRYAMDATHYALVDQVISQFPNNFVERSKGTLFSRCLAADSEGMDSPGGVEHPSEEVKMCHSVLGMGDDLLLSGGGQDRLSDCVKPKVIGLERPERMAANATSSEDCHTVPPCVPGHDKSSPVEKCWERKDVTFRTLLEADAHAGKELGKCYVEQAVLCSNGNAGICPPTALHFVKAIAKKVTSVCDADLLAPAVGEEDACHSTHSAVLEVNVASLHPGFESQLPSGSELNNTTSVRKRKHSGHQSPQAVKRRIVEPGGCTSGPVSCASQQNNGMALAVTEAKPLQVPCSTEKTLTGSIMTPVVECLTFPVLPFDPATPLLVMAQHTFPRDLQHYEQLLGHWECFSPRIDVDQTMPSGMTGSRDDWDTNPETLQPKTVDQGVRFSCSLDVPACNELSSVCYRDHKECTSVLLERQTKEPTHYATDPPNPLHFCPSGYSARLSTQVQPKHISSVGTADASCPSAKHVLTPDVEIRPVLPQVECFSSLSDWDVQLLSRLDSLHTVKDATPDMEDLRRTSVSMQDTGYESHLCSVLKPRSELDWVLKGERGNVSCWAESDCIPFNMFEACINSWTS
ncbi:protein DBF4 homolog B [Ambystoma mexicanum]|uniref:protein DBF4 homolog B n=1 Tax=Ambystoma mexicanum TaxID=8296 RepID=UPI0037E99D35